MSTLQLPWLKSESSTASGWHLWLLVLTPVIAVVGLWLLWIATSSAVTITVDGISHQVRTHRNTVGSVLFDYGVRPRAVDNVYPASETSLDDGEEIVVSRASGYLIAIDGQLVDAHSWGETVGDVLADAGLNVDLYDTVLIGEQEVGLGAAVPSQHVTQSAQTFLRNPWTTVHNETVKLSVNRATPITVDDGTLPFVINTTAQTVGEALQQAEFPVYLGDLVQPSLGSEIQPTMRVTIQRSQPVSFDVDGQIIRTRTRGETVADALAEANIGISSLDEVSPGLGSQLRTNEHITVLRVQEDVEVEEEIAPYTTVFVSDAALPIDTQQLITAGAEGITRSRYRVRYENGEETEHVLEDSWVAQEPAERSIAYGQRIDPKTFVAEDGNVYTYWRKVRMLASSYSAGTAGVSPDKSYYGRTYTGDIMRHGIVAVDPSIIPLRSSVYVPGYGEGEALDVGSAIRARRIDLGYDDSNLVLWSKWVDVYLLWPPPASHQITWVLPNWPRPPE